MALTSGDQQRPKDRRRLYPAGTVTLVHDCEGDACHCGADDFDRDTGDDFDPGPEVDDDGGMSEYRRQSSVTRDFDLPEDLLAALRNPAVPARQEDGAFGRLVSWVVAPPSNKSVFSPGEVLPADQFLWWPGPGELA